MSVFFSIVLSSEFLALGPSNELTGKEKSPFFSYTAGTSQEKISKFPACKAAPYKTPCKSQFDCSTPYFFPSTNAAASLSSAA
jgi:hypothetical protein